MSRLAFLNNVGLDYLALDRSAETLSGGEAQRIRLASQIGSGLTGVMYVLDEPSIGLHQRDNDRLLDDAQAPARPRQQRDRRRARPGRDPVRRPRRRHGAGRRRARRAGRRAGHAGGHPPRAALADRPVPRGPSPDSDSGAAPSRDAPKQRADDRAARTGNNLQDVTLSCRWACSSASPACRARASRRSSTTRCTTPSRGTSTTAPEEPAPLRGDRRPRAFRQGDQRRPEPDRPHAALAIRRPTPGCSRRSASCSRR